MKKQLHLHLQFLGSVFFALAASQKQCKYYLNCPVKFLHGYNVLSFVFNEIICRKKSATVMLLYAL